MLNKDKHNKKRTGLSKLIWQSDPDMPAYFLEPIGWLLGGFLFCFLGLVIIKILEFFGI